MTRKTDKLPSEGPKKTGRRPDSDRPVDEIKKKPLRQVEESNENLRQRAEWYRRRTGADN